MKKSIKVATPCRLADAERILAGEFGLELIGVRELRYPTLVILTFQASEVELELYLRRRPGVYVRVTNPKSRASRVRQTPVRSGRVAGWGCQPTVANVS